MAGKAQRRQEASPIESSATYRVLNAVKEPASVIYVIDSVEHPFDIAQAADGCASMVVSIPIANWNDALTPWPAPGFYENEPWFGGHGHETLRELTEQVIPAIEAELGIASYVESFRKERSGAPFVTSSLSQSAFEATAVKNTPHSIRTDANSPHPRKGGGAIKRAICGYSLGGLFALYAFVNDERFDACASISGSLWYQGWMGYLREAMGDPNGETGGEQRFDACEQCAIPPISNDAASGNCRFDGRGRYAFLSVGKKECKPGLPLFRCVEDSMHASAELLHAAGCRVYTSVGPGNHMQHIPERFDEALKAVDTFLVGDLKR